MTATATATCPDCGSDLLRRPKPQESGKLIHTDEGERVCVPCRMDAFRGVRTFPSKPVAFFNQDGEMEADAALDALLDLMGD